MGHAHNKPALVTDAEPSRHEQLRSRQLRYGIMMAIRAVLLIVASILVTTKTPGLWLWLSLCAAGMVILPWAAVMIANDRPPKDRYKMTRWRRGRKSQEHPNELGHTEFKTIDSELHPCNTVACTARLELKATDDD
ncbi:MAG TPA: DUF3099 domain-containing protein [Candidatus Stackebrandtia faecavium]|nr:DUF3099 domain-containing protein [Candidatus Stackebrandtia faecavium]